MSKELFNDGGRIVTADGTMVDHIRSASDVRRFLYPLYIPAGYVVCPECKGSGSAERSFWDYLFGKTPMCDVCMGHGRLKRLPPPPTPPPKRTCQHCGGTPC